MRKITLLVTFMFAFIAQGYAQLPESFEGETFPPAGWARFIGTNGAGTAQGWVRSTAESNTGDASAFVRWENVSPNAIAEDWLVTPQITVTAEAPMLQFFQAKQFGDPYTTSYTVRVSTASQTTHADFVTLLSMTESDLSTEFTPRQVDLSNFVGQQVYIAFVMSQDDGDSWYIDDVSMTTAVSAPTCASNPTPADGATGLPIGNSTFSWAEPTGGDVPLGYKLFYGITADDVTNPLGVYETNSADLNIGDYDFTFYWKVVPYNAGGDATGCPVWSFSTMASNGACLSAPNGMYPWGVFEIEACDGTTENIIDDYCYAGEYSTVAVSAGQEYQFLSYNDVNDDNITLALENGTILAHGQSPLTWTSTISGIIYFYSHVDIACTDEEEFRTRSVICIPSEALPDYVSLQWPANETIDEAGTVVIYGQIYEAGLTDVEPGLSGQAAGIEAWVGFSEENTDPAGWEAWQWVPADFNSQHVSNNDEYALAIGGFPVGTYYYATRFRLDGGAYVYGGINQSEPHNGHFWDGDMFVNGILTVEAAPAPANDDCEGAVTLTAAPTFQEGLTDALLIGATDSPQEGTENCNGYDGQDIWFTVAVPASGSLTIETGPTIQGIDEVDTVITVYSGDCASLTEIGCNDDGAGSGYSLVELVGLEEGTTLYIRAYSYGAGSNGWFGISAYDASLSTGGFGRNGFSAYPNPVKDVLNLSHAQEITKASVYNLLGQEVFTKAIGASEAQLDLSSLAQGAYIVKVAAGNVTDTIKIIKE
jgi:hypothetical protein